MEEVGYSFPTDVQRQALPHLFSGRDCILHAQVHLSLLFFHFYVPFKNQFTGRLGRKDKETMLREMDRIMFREHDIIK